MRNFINSLRRKIAILIIVGLALQFDARFLIAPKKAEAAFNQQINFQGKLTDSLGAVVSDGTYHMRFFLYTTATGGSSLWDEDRSTDAGDRVTVTNGLFSVMLGSSTPLTGVDFNQTLYLGVEVGGSSGSASWDGEMSPRKIIGAVPAAFEAKNLGGLNETQFLRTDAVNSTSTASTFVTFTQNGAGNILDLYDGSTNVFTAIDGGNIGIGTTSPYTRLSVEGSSALGNSALAGYFIGTTTATSTLVGGLSTDLLNVSSTTASSTFANGINLSAGCFAVNGTCLSGADGTGFGEAFTIGTNTFSQSALVPTTTQNLAINGVGTSTFAGGLEAWRQISAPYFQATSTTATSSLPRISITALSLGSDYIQDITGTGLQISGNSLAVNLGDFSTTNLSEGSNLYWTDTRFDNRLSATTSVSGITTLPNLSLPTSQLTGTLGVANGGTGATTFGQGWIYTDGGTNTLAASTSPTVNYITATSTTATSTFAAGIRTTALNVTSTTASSTFANGINLSAGCFAINGTCVGQGVVSNGTAGYVAYYDTTGSTVSATSSLFFNTTTGAVGVGTTTPTTTAKLTVDGRLNVTSANGAVVVGRTDGGSRGINSIDLQTERSTGAQVASGLNAVTLGSRNTASGQYTNAIGFGNSASANNALAVGKSNTSSNTQASTFGYINSATGNFSIAVGSNNTAAGTGSSVFGYTNSTNANYSSAVGYNNTGSSSYASAFGFTNSAGGAASAFGYSNTASASRSSAFGYTNTASGTYSTAIGYNNTASASHAIAIGYQLSNTIANSAQFGASNTAKLTILSTGETQAPFFTSTTTGATSTFFGLSADILNVSSTTASSTFANGINLSAGCFAINGTCVGGSGSSVSIDWKQITDTFGVTALRPTTTLPLAIDSTATSSFAGGLEAWRQIAAPYFEATSTTATSTFNGGLTTGSSGLNVLTNGKIGIGNIAPNNKFTIGNVSNWKGLADLAVKQSATYSFILQAPSDDSVFEVSNTSGHFQLETNYNSSGSYQPLYIKGGGGQSIILQPTAGNVGIGTTSPYARLSVEGSSALGNSALAGYFIGTTTATSTLAGGLSTDLLNVSSTTASSTFANGINLSAGCFAINGTCVGGAAASTVSIDWKQITDTFGVTALRPTTTLSLAIDSTATSSFAGGLEAWRQISAPYFNATSTTATSTFAWGIKANALNITSTSASSTFANGINLSAGCFAINGTCVGGGSGTVTSGTAGYVAYYNTTGTAVSATSSLFFNTTTGALGIGTTTPTTTAKLTVDGSLHLTSANAAVVIGRTDGGTRGNFALDIQSGRTAGSQVAAGSNSVAVGYANTVGSCGSGTALGVSNTANSFQGAAVGYSNTTAVVSNASAFGVSNTASGYYSSSFGYGNIVNAGATNSSAFGRSNTVNTSVDYASAFGYSNTVSGLCGASAFGYINTASGTGGQAFGYNNTASGSYAGAFGLSVNNSIANSAQFGASDTAKLTILSTGETQAPFFTATTTNATSTFTRLAAEVLHVSTTTATSSFAWGVNIKGGCFAINGTCVGGGSGGAFTSAGGYTTLNTATDNVGIGTSTPYAKLSVVGETVARNFTATSTSATSTFAGGFSANSGGIISDFSSGLTTIGNLELGTMSFASDAGTVSWADLPVTSSASLGTIESYTAQIDGNSLFTLYSQSDGAGGVQNLKVGIGTTTPAARFSIAQVTDVATSSLWLAASDGDYRAIYMNTSQVLNFGGGAGNTATLDSAGAWTNAPSFSWLKQDRAVLDRDTLFDILATTSIETFKVISDVDNFGDAADTKLGIVLDEAHPLLSDRDINGDIYGFSPIRTAAAAFRGVQVIIDALDIRSAPTTTASLTVTSTGNIGIGTTTPNYKLQVVGDVAATAFVNTSTRESKTDISYLKSEDYQGFLDKLNDINLATYKYKTEATSTPVDRLGLIAEEAPSEVLSVNKDGVDIYKLTSFTLGATKALNEKVASLELKLKDIEDLKTTGGSISMSSVLSALENLGVKISQGMVKMKALVLDTLTIGSEEKPTAITIYDKDGKPGCLTIDDVNTGAMKVSPGVCVNSTSDNSDGGDTPETDTTPPVITLNGLNPSVINKGESYIDLGATVTDNINQNLGITVTGDQIDTSIVGEYTITYTATDQALNTATTTRTVIVRDPNAPVDEEPETPPAEEPQPQPETPPEEVVEPSVEEPVVLEPVDEVPVAEDITPVSNPENPTSSTSTSTSTPN